jgi:hypothetical protein
VPIAVILLGLVLIDLAFRGTEHRTAKLLAADFGEGSKFWTWAAAIAVVGALGYAAPLRGVSTALLTLVLVSLILSQGGLFEKLADVIMHPPKASAAVPLTAYAGVFFGSGTPAAAQTASSGGGGGGIGGILPILGHVAAAVGAPFTGGATLALDAVATAASAAASSQG